MNRKNKNKNRPKPPHPAPPQKQEPTPIISEKIEDIPQDIESEPPTESRVPEIVPNPIEVKEPVDSPKKPKRNKGKKKKQDKEDDFEDTTEEKNLETSDVKEIKDNEENLEIKEEKIEQSSNVAPTARKKKNKKKGSQANEEIKQENVEQKEDTIVKIEEETVQLLQTTDETIPLQNEPIEQEFKTAKKKNKKKKHRNDSEKSDKTEDSAACTSAFQKLLEPQEEISVQSELTKENVQMEIINKNVEYAKIENQSENITEDDIELIPITDFAPEEKPEETIKIEKKEENNKYKNKNKKEKKNIPKEEEISEVQSKSLEESILPSLEESKSSSSPLVDVNKPEEIALLPDNKDQTDVMPLEAPAEKIESPKPKAKIAKPVEKKRKGKADKPDKEPTIVPDDTSSDLKSEVTMDKIESEKPEPHKEITENKDEVILTEAETEKKITSDLTGEAKIATPEVELLQPAEKDTKKKRKKSPKPAKNIEKETEQEKVEEKITTTTKDKNVETSKCEPSEPKDMSSINKIEQEDLPPNVQEEVKTILPKQEVEEIEAPAMQTMGKKRKKGPKFPSTSDVKETTAPIPLPPPPTRNVTEKSENLPKEQPSEPKESKDDEMSKDTKEEGDIFFDMPSMVDVEISSMETEESEGSACETSPDFIQYPRSTSQQRSDDNNNMLIQELHIPEDVKLGVPIFIPDTPLITGSGETPTSPDLIIIPEPKSCNVSDIAKKQSEQEKTDIKSKMIEVNQDMEELRLSIERSLAELTAIEKSEDDMEKEMVSLHITEETETKAPTDINMSQSCVNQAENVTQSQSLPTEVPQPVQENILSESIIIDQPPITEEIPNLPQKQPDDSKTEVTQEEKKDIQPTPTEKQIIEGLGEAPPVCPARKEHKGKKSRKKGRQEAESNVTPASSTSTTASTSDTKTPTTESKESSQETKKEEKSENQSEPKQEKGKQQSDALNNNDSNLSNDSILENIPDYEPIENFEDAMTSSVDDVNKTFEIIANELDNTSTAELTRNAPEISVTAPIEDTSTKNKKEHPVSQPKNLLGHPDIPAPSNRTDYKKEKNRPPNTRQAKVKIKDSMDIEKSAKENKQSKESQTESKRKFLKNTMNETISSVNGNEEYIYKYSYRKVFLPSACHVCKKELKQARVCCNFCNLVFYCNQKHKDEDWSHHQALCFAISTIVHLKEQKHIYADAKDVYGHNYRLLRMQMIVSCEKVLKRKLVPWEQETLLYPRICADVACREWRQGKLTDCDGCGQVSYCSDHPEHLPKSHQRWCKSYALYQKLVIYQQTVGRLEPKLPGKVMADHYTIPDKMNEVLASMYEEKIDMNDIQYAALTQIATAPLTAAYCHQLYNSKVNPTNGINKKSTFTMHVVGAELQFEADALNKWEVFFLHLRPSVKELRVVLIASDLNPSNLPLDLLGKIRLCDQCRQNKRRVVFCFQDKKAYHDYWGSDEFVAPDIVCAFNPSIQRSSIYNGKDPWPPSINCILKAKTPFIVTSYSLTELSRDLARIKECSNINFNVICEPKQNNFASVRPDRNFISDDEIPLLFKNYCFMVICGV